MTRLGSRVLRTTGTTLRKTLFGAMATFLVLSATSTVATASHDLSVHGAGVDDNTVYQGQLFTIVNGGVKMYRRGGVKMYCGLGGSLSP